MCRILIADDKEMIRTRLKGVIREHFADVVFGEAGSGDEALLKVSETPWDVVLMDINMPGKSGLQVLKDMRKDADQTPVILLSLNTKERYEDYALKQGANAYFEKISPADDLLECIGKMTGAKGRLTLPNS